MTKIFETQYITEIDNKISSAFAHEENELPIALTQVDDKNWTLLTTQKIISNIEGKMQQAPAKNIIKWTWGNFKGYVREIVTLGRITFKDDSTLNILIETGSASMIMIYGIRTLTGREISTADQINKTLSRYQKRGFLE